ncbi:glycoside hydrolase family 3 N-terminal domain-containing protein [Fusibacter bizertensis]|uniref:beta-glucosidase n=1 Tax=Fusibacter bizertensis TaxID=1488331 RepID=A0ABT6N9C4_9FIRM|nr:glycoside hydrolase family 3 N-terminal domain-containing protein [Fusibacter bizertensis]MDH8677020.1 glycoside hydrolase family 3 N-terminal domain-containing protein [Fusibacter bizertensis]
MKSGFKKGLSLLMVLVMILSLSVGCSDKNSNDDTQSTSESTTGSIETTEETNDGAIVMKEPIPVEEWGSGTVKWSEEDTDFGFTLVNNDGGETIGYSKESGLKLIQVDGFAFKDLNANNMLDQYEDWRESDEARAMNLASILPVENIAGLMLYSAHVFAIGETLDEAQLAFLDAGGRSVLNAASAAAPETGALWNNAMQVYAEKTPFGIPVNTSSDPRDVGISAWPSNLALAATFDPQVAKDSAMTISQEYRLIGIGTLLGPQIDLASEARWVRIQGTFGEDPALSRDMTASYVDGIQSSYDASGNDLGWGKDSMNAMIKHWPGDGAAEGGRESHALVGNSAVYPGGQFETSLIPFVDGGLKLEGKTGEASSIMSSYSIAYDEDEAYGELIGSAYSEYKIKDLLRGQYGYEGVICTDWGVINDPEEFIHTSWGAEDMTKAERVYRVLTVGVDQFGGHNSNVEILEAYDIGVADIGEEAMRARFEESAVRLLKNIFNVNLFDNAYIDVDETKEVVGSDALNAKGFDAALKSVVMLKNKDNTIKAATEGEKPTVYIPMLYRPAAASDFGAPTPAKWFLPVDLEVASEYFNVVTDTVNATLTGEADADGNATIAYADIKRASAKELAGCDFSLAVVDGPMNAGSMFAGYGFDPATQSYVPMTLQYGKYTADSEFVRKESISGSMIEEKQDSVYGTQTVEVKENRSYFGKDAIITNATDLDAIEYAAANMPESAKTIVAIRAQRPVIVSEFENDVDAIIVGFGIKDKALLEVAAGKYEPSGLLPVQFPKDMETVEQQFEDVPRDMVSYTDSEGNIYDFAFGLNWAGVIDDARTAKYGVAPLVTPTNTGK